MPSPLSDGVPAVFVIHARRLCTLDPNLVLMPLLAVLNWRRARRGRYARRPTPCPIHFTIAGCDL